jgi:hypothetical protein
MLQAMQDGRHSWPKPEIIGLGDYGYLDMIVAKSE